MTSPGTTRIPAFVKICAAARRKQEAARAKERERREQAVAKAQRHSQTAKREHDTKASAIDAEDARWESALRRVREYV